MLLRKGTFWGFYSLPFLSGVTPIGQGWKNARGLRGLGGPKPGPNFLYILIFQILGVSHQPMVILVSS